jgi:hypothetical protein
MILKMDNFVTDKSRLPANTLSIIVAFAFFCVMLMSSWMIMPKGFHMFWQFSRLSVPLQMALAGDVLLFGAVMVCRRPHVREVLWVLSFAPIGMMAFTPLPNLTTISDTQAIAWMETFVTLQLITMWTSVALFVLWQLPDISARFTARWTRRHRAQAIPGDLTPTMNMPAHCEDSANLRPDLQLGPLAMFVHGRKFPDSHDLFDGNYLDVEAVVTTPTATVRVRNHFLSLLDIGPFREELEALEQHYANASNGTATSLPHPHMTSIAVKRHASIHSNVPFFALTCDNTNISLTLEFTICLTSDRWRTQEHTFIVRLDRSVLGDLVRQLLAIEQSYPLRRESPLNPAP